MKLGYNSGFTDKEENVYLGYPNNLYFQDDNGNEHLIIDTKLRKEIESESYFYKGVEFEKTKHKQKFKKRYYSKPPAEGSKKF